MPRLSPARYEDERAWLRRVWETCQVVYAVNTYATQLDIHRFYAPTRELLGDELAQYRADVTAQDASLPQRAGKGLLRMRSVIAGVMAEHDQPTMGHVRQQVQASAGAAGTGKRRVRVLAVARPELDYERLAAALVQIAHDRATSAGPGER